MPNISVFKKINPHSCFCFQEKILKLQHENKISNRNTLVVEV